MTNTDLFHSLRGTAPDELLDFLAQVVGFLPDEFKFRLREVMRTLPQKGDNMHRVLELVRRQWKDIQFEQWVRVAIVGPSHTGKNTLMRMINQKEVRTVGPIFRIVELPGLEEYLGYESSLAGPSELSDADIFLLVLDAQLGVSDSTTRMVNRLKELGKPVLVVLNKVDLVENSGQVVREARRQLRSKVFPASAVSERSIDKLFGAIAATDSRALYPLTQTFPHFRRNICNAVVTQAAVASSLVGGLRIPVSDMLPLTAIQTAMLLKIARAFGHRLGWSRARELGPMLVAGFVARKAVHGLGERFRRHKTLIDVTAAGTGTFAMGRVAIRYFERFSNLLEPPAAEPAPMIEAGDR